MKRLLTTTLFLSLVLGAWAQAPQQMTYQAVVRDGSDQLVSNAAIGMQISVLQNSPTGIAVFIETHTPTTNGNGLATVEIGTGNTVAGSFSGIDWANGPYFLKTETDPNGGTAYTISGTTQLLSVPYSLYAETAGSVAVDLVDDADADPTNELQNLQLSGQSLSISNGNTVTLPSSGNTLDEAYDQGGAGAGRVITVDAGEVELINGTANGIGLRATTTNTGVGILANSSNAGNGFSPIQATTTSSSNLTSAIVGSTSGGASAVSGQVESTASAAQGVYGNNLRTTGGYGVYGIGHTGTVGETNYQLGFGVYGRNYDAIGPLGNAVGTYGFGYVGVWGDQTDPNGFSIYANGDFGAAGTKAFSIDHPLDPEKKYLKHYSIESNEVLNMYRGTVAFDANGEAKVTMPDYFDAVNANFSYQLTPIGGYAPLYIKEKLNDGKFVIAGGAAGMEVSWTVYAERNDPYIQQHPESKAVEVEKEEWNQGKYLQPDLYGQPDSKKIVKPLETGDVDPETGVEQKEIEILKNE
ncbi:MAG: hypothetical protein P8P74_17190 [Crocinitomicaceae bacterium]|nr:hypothetical protein [Crocinitomicaceae bacterium]